jgi:hypothetical protein
MWDRSPSRGYGRDHSRSRDARRDQSYSRDNRHSRSLSRDDVRKSHHQSSRNVRSSRDQRIESKRRSRSPLGDYVGTSSRKYGRGRERSRTKDRSTTFEGKTILHPPGYESYRTPRLPSSREHGRPGCSRNSRSPGTSYRQRTPERRKSSPKPKHRPTTPGNDTVSPVAKRRVMEKPPISAVTRAFSLVEDLTIDDPPSSD